MRRPFSQNKKEKNFFPTFSGQSIARQHFEFNSGIFQIVGAFLALEINEKKAYNV